MKPKAESLSFNNLTDCFYRIRTPCKVHLYRFKMSSLPDKLMELIINIWLSNDNYYKGTA